MPYSIGEFISTWWILTFSSLREMNIIYKYDLFIYLTRFYKEILYLFLHRVLQIQQAAHGNEPFFSWHYHQAHIVADCQKKYVIIL